MELKKQKRLEHFAGLAMQGLIANAPSNNLGNSKEGCQLAVQWAIDLIEEIDRKCEDE